jgi:hypothetical protein
VSWPIGVFDALAANTDRNEHNWGVIDDMPHIVLIDHGHAFEAQATDSGFATRHRDEALPSDILKAVEAFAADPAESRLCGLLAEDELARVFSRADAIRRDGKLTV